MKLIKLLREYIRNVLLNEQIEKFAFSDLKASWYVSVFVSPRFPTIVCHKQAENDAVEYWCLIEEIDYKNRWMRLGDPLDDKKYTLAIISQNAKFLASPKSDPGDKFYRS
jgi:hypothetical protein